MMALLWAINCDLLQETCPKRKAQCAYCEIECARDELEAHTEYCGTRTEQCAACSQFIMHKDQLQHDATQCSYPPQPEPSTQQPAAANRNSSAFTGLSYLGDTYGGGSSFRSNELLRLVEPHASFLGPRHRPSNGRPSVTSHAHQIPRDYVRSDPYQAAAGSSGASNAKRSPTKRSVVTRRNDLRPKNTNVQREQAKLQAKAEQSFSQQGASSNLNLTENDRASAFDTTSNDTARIDRMLAMQLGHGLDIATADFENLDFDQLSSSNNGASTVQQGDGGNFNTPSAMEEHPFLAPQQHHFGMSILVLYRDINYVHLLR